MSLGSHLYLASTFLKDGIITFYCILLVILATTTACPLLRLITCASYLAFSVATLSQLLSLTTREEKRREACQREEERGLRFACTSWLSTVFLSDRNIFEMGLKIYHFGYSPFLCLFLYIPLVLQFHSAAANFTIDFLKTPKTFSNSPTATFAFEVKDSNSGLFCSNCDIKCQVRFFNLCLLSFMNVLIKLVRG